MTEPTFISLVYVLAVVTFSGLFTGLCVRALRKKKDPSKLKLRGLPIQTTRKDGRLEVESMRFHRQIQSMMETLEKGMNDEAAPRLVSRLEWWNQINRYLDMLKNTSESIDSVATGIEVLMNYHQLHRTEAEEDFVDALFNRALHDATLSHLYAKLLKRLRGGDQKGWAHNIVRRLFQLSVEEFNWPLPHDNENGVSRRKKSNNIKLMAAIFKREMPGVSDDWITDCADTLVQRLDTCASEQSVEELCLFLTTLLIAEPGESCDSIVPSRQRQLFTCFEALVRATTPTKVTKQPALTPETLEPESDFTESDSETESETSTDTDSYDPEHM